MVVVFKQYKPCRRQYHYKATTDHHMIRANRVRNFAIGQLRGIHRQISHLLDNPDHIKAVQAYIDNQLWNMGAEMESERRERTDKYFVDYLGSKDTTDIDKQKHWKEFDKPFGGKEPDDRREKRVRCVERIMLNGGRL